MKEKGTVEVLLYNRETKRRQNVNVTAESVRDVVNAGGLMQATMIGIKLEAEGGINPEEMILTEDILVSLYPIQHLEKGKQN